MKKKQKEDELIQELFEIVWKLLKVVRMSCSPDAVMCSCNGSFNVGELHDKALKLCLEHMELKK